MALALAFKGLDAESVWVDRGDRSEVRRVSGQDLVPVIEDDGRVVVDSMEIVRYLEERRPEPPLYPREPARRAETLVFVDWFNRVWKRWPRQIATELQKPEPDAAVVAEAEAELARALDLFEELLDGRDYLLGDFSAADCAAFPFVKYALIWPEGDHVSFHELLRDYQPLGGARPRVGAWIRRVDELPRA